MSARFERLKMEVLERSQEKNCFERAIIEWKFAKMVKPSVAKYCLCTQEIGTDFQLVHKVTGQEITVGSICIHRFWLPSVELVKAVDRAEYEADRRPCDRCAEWTVHPEYCKNAKKL